MSPERDHVALRPEQATIPPGHPWNRIPVIGAGVRPAGRGGLRDSGGGESEAVLLLVARVVPVLSEPGPRRALLRADPVRDPGRMGDRAATDRGDDLRNAPRDGGPLPPVAPRPARSLLVDRSRGSRARCAASLEGAIPQRAVLPDPGGALLRSLVLHRPPLLPRLARSGRDGGSRGVGPPAPPRRARHHRPRADPDLRLDRLDHVAHAALVLDHVRRLFLRGFLRRVHRAALGRRGGDARGGAAGHGHQRRAPAGYRKVPVRIHGVLGLHRLLPVLPHVVREPPGGDDLVQGADRGVLDARSRSSSWRDISWLRSST